MAPMTYYWVLQTETRGVKSVDVIETATTARPSFENTYSTELGLYGPYSMLAAADMKVLALGGTPAATSQSGYSGTAVQNAAGQEVGVVNPQTGQYISTGNSDTNPGISIPGLSQIGDFFSRLTQASTWLRVLEAILGAGLILVGLAHLAGNTQVGRTAKTIATRAALL
jgi:hypothetical protein